jgi:rhodanese-related sulfurtransferase
MKTILIAMLTLVLTVVCASSADEGTLPATKVRRIGVEEFEKLRANTNAVLLDVRSAAEFEKGHIPGALNIDINSPQFAEKAASLDKSKPYLVNCAVGMRSARACKKLEGMGFTNLFDLAPGFDGWKKAGKPVQK